MGQTPGWGVPHPPPRAAAITVHCGERWRHRPLHPVVSMATASPALPRPPRQRLGTHGAQEHPHPPHGPHASLPRGLFAPPPVVPTPRPPSGCRREATSLTKAHLLIAQIQIPSLSVKPQHQRRDFPNPAPQSGVAPPGHHWKSPRVPAGDSNGTGDTSRIRPLPAAATISTVV